jgi:hypothetical protein
LAAIAALIGSGADHYRDPALSYVGRRSNTFKTSHRLTVAFWFASLPLKRERYQPQQLNRGLSVHRAFEEKLRMIIRRQRFQILSGHLTTCSRPIIAIVAITILTLSLGAQTSTQDQNVDLKPSKGTKLTVHGYVRDIACLMKYNEALKPTNDCAVMCARVGSPLVIVTAKGTIYTPISDSIPDTSMREKLMPFVGTYVEIKGEVYQRAGIKAIVIAQIKRADDTKS